MAVTYGGLSCLDPGEIYEDCLRQDLPVAWYRKANQYVTTVGPDPARAWILMSRGTINSLNVETSASLAFSDDNLGSTAVIADMYFFRAKCITPGLLGDPTAAYLVELVDARHLAKNDYYGTPTYAQYNVPAPAGGALTYYQESLNAGNPWGWQDILDELWNQELEMTLLLGASPQLPVGFTPDGLPENFRFIGVSAWEAYNSALKRLGCVLVNNPAIGSGDPTLQKFQIVQYGAIDLNEAAAEAAFFGRRVLDEDCIESSIAKVPGALDVAFHKVAQHYGTEATTQPGVGQWSLSAVHVETILNVSGGVGKGLVWDDLAAVVDINGNILNQAALTSRAQQRAADYERQLGTQGARMRRTYMGVVFDPRLLPGSQIAGYCLRDRGNGTYTDVWRFPRTGDDAFSEDTPQNIRELNEWLRSPDFGRATVPNYPPYDQPLRINGPGQATGIFDATVQIFNPANLANPLSAENCWVFGLNSDTLETGDVLLGRINGSFADNGVSRPLYLADQGAGGGGGPASIIVQNTSGSQKVLNVNTLIFDPDSDWTITDLGNGKARVNRVKNTITVVTNVTCNANTGVIVVTTGQLTYSV